jgi:ubiquinone/menaquinone biosynthesis C-methylase UbiE
MRKVTTVDKNDQADQQRSLKLYNRRASIYNFSHHVQTLWADSYHRKELARTAGLRAHMTVLDIGCGTGLLSLELLKHYKDIRIIAVDYSPAMLRRFRKAALKNGNPSNLYIVQGNAEALPLKSGSIDAALSIYGLGGVPRPDAAMGEIKRVVAGNGIVCLGEMVQPPGRYGRLSRWIHKKIVEPMVKRFWEFRDVNLPELLDKYGFEVKESKYYRNRLLGSMLIMKARRPGNQE